MLQLHQLTGWHPENIHSLHQKSYNLYICNRQHSFEQAHEFVHPKGQVRDSALAVERETKNIPHEYYHREQH